MSDKALAIICVDRDGDFSKKAGIPGPIIGRKDNLQAAVKLSLSDPTDSDANTVYAAIKRFDSLKSQYKKIEIITLVGSEKFGFDSDIKINEQLDRFLNKFKADQFVLVTDGAEDDQIIPILQSRAPIIAKETVIVKQAKSVESAYYTIKEALKDPFLARAVFGIPGIIILLYLLMPTIGLQLVAGLFGVYLILKGFGLEDKILGGIKEITTSISSQRVSFPFYIGAILIALFGILSAGPPLYEAYLGFQSGNFGIGTAQAAIGIDFLVMFGVVAGLIYLFGKGADAVQLKKAFLLRTYLLSGVAVVLAGMLLGTAKGVAVGTTTLNLFLASLLVSFIVFFVSYKATSVIDIRRKVTKLLIGLPVYSHKGKWLGKVEKIHKETKKIELTIKNKKVQLEKQDFVLEGNKLLLRNSLSKTRA
jgi:putative membrane protein